MSNPTELPDLERLTRWTFDYGMTAAVSADGQWLRYDDVRLMMARRAQPEAEAEYTVDHRELAGKILSFAGISSRGSLEPGADQLADRLAEKLAGWGVKFGQPEGEAPQADLTRRQKENAEFSEWWASSGQQATHDLITENAAHATWQEKARRAATLSPLCGAQHAESGKEAELGCGGSGKCGVGDLPCLGCVNCPSEDLAAQQAAVPGAVEGRLVSVDVSTGDEDYANRIFAELTGETGSDGTTLIAIEKSRNFSVPGTPEALAEPEYELHQDDMMVAGTSGKRAYEEILRYAEQYAQDGPVELYKVIRTKITIPCAAQLDGGQEGSDHA